MASLISHWMYLWLYLIHNKNPTTKELHPQHHQLQQWIRNWYLRNHLIWINFCRHDLCGHWSPKSVVVNKCDPSDLFLLQDWVRLLRRTSRKLQLWVCLEIELGATVIWIYPSIHIDGLFLSCCVSYIKQLLNWYLCQRGPTFLSYRKAPF